MIAGLPFSSSLVQERAQAILQQVACDPAFLTLIADLSTLASRCRFAVRDQALVARYVDLPFPALSFWGRGPALAEAIAGLLQPGEPCYTLVAAAQRADLSGVTREVDVVPEWQMVHRGDPAGLDPGRATPLGPADLPAMKALAASGEMGAFKDRALEGGPHFGLWEGGRLVSMAGTRLQVSGLAEIGNVVTHPDYRRRGLAQAVVAATARALYKTSPTVLLHVVETNDPALALYERLSLERLRLMYLVRFVR